MLSSHRMSLVSCGLVLAFMVAAPALSAHAKADVPRGGTQQLLDDGAKIVKGEGICTACHGPDAKGLKGMGANLTDDQGLHSKGSYPEIVKQIQKGVPGNVSTTKMVMPPK